MKELIRNNNINNSNNDNSVNNSNQNNCKYDNNVLNFLNEEHDGFQGLTHWLISVLFFLLMWLIPWSFGNNFIASIRDSVGFTFLIFFVIGGGSLLPDLDSSTLQGGGSTAIYQLGILGEALSIAMITISGVIYSICHTRYDDKPKSQHRMLFHAPIIAILIYLFVLFSIPNTNQRVLDNISVQNVGILILVFFAGVSIYLGSNMLIYKLLKLIGRQYQTQFICLGIMTISVFYMVTMPYSRLKLVGTALALGYLFHIIADVFTKGSAPLFFPIPVPNKKGHLRFWWHPYLISSKFTITTGSIVNIILNFVLMGLDIFLTWFIFIK